MDDNNIKLPYFGIPKILPYLKEYKLRIIVMVLLGLITSFFDAAYPLFHSYAIDHYIGHNTLDTIKIFVLLYIFILVANAIMNYFALFMACKLEMQTNQKLRNAAFNHLQTLSFSYFNQNNVGYIHARVMSDTGKIGELVAWRLMDIVWNGTYVVAAFIYMFILNAKLATYIILLIPIAVIFVIFFQKRLLVLNRRIREINSKISSNYNEGITGVRSIKTLVIENIIEEDFRKDTLDMKNTTTLSNRYSAFFSSTIIMLSSIALAIVLWQGGILTKENVMLVGSLSVFMNYAVNIIDPIQWVIENIALIIGVQVNIERFTKLMNTQSDVADSKEVIEKYGDSFNPKKENWEELEGDVEFKDVSFKYPDGNEMVLEHFNLKVPKGTSVAIVGETGAGKSTLVNLVCRFFEPTTGEVLIDGRNAKERSQLWLHSNIGYVLQTPHLFSGTIRDNLRYGKEDATDEEIYKALDLVSARFVIEKMDKGLDSEVGEGGDLLSTGEKQLLSFARAIIADPKILVLDEATASIDTLTEKAIQEAIKTVIQGRTSFIIAHRLSTIVDANIIFVVDDGKIIESGNHQELMKLKGAYYNLYTKQYEELMIKNSYS